MFEIIVGIILALILCYWIERSEEKREEALADLYVSTFSFSKSEEEVN